MSKDMSFEEHLEEIENSTEPFIERCMRFKAYCGEKDFSYAAAIMHETISRLSYLNELDSEVAEVVSTTTQLQEIVQKLECIIKEEK